MAARAEILGDDSVVAFARAARSWDGTPGTASAIQLNGYYPIECDQLERAVELAGQLAEERYAPVEERAVEFT